MDGEATAGSGPGQHPRQGPRRHHRRRLEFDPPRRLRAREPGTAAGVQREGAVRPGARPGRHRPAQSRRRRDGAGQHRPLHHACPQHEGDVARPAGHRGGARRRRRRRFHARAGEPARHQAAHRERPGRGALLGLRRDLRHARRGGRDGRPGWRQPRAGRGRAGQARQLQHAPRGPAPADVVGQGRSQEDRRRCHRERALAARGDRQDLLCRGRRLAFVRPAAHGAGGLSAAHHPSLRHRGRRGARGRPPDRRAERQVAGEDAGRVAPARRHPAARLPGARPAAGGAEAAQRGVLRLRPARGVLLFAPQRSRARAPSADRLRRGAGCRLAALRSGARRRSSTG